MVSREGEYDESVCFLICEILGGILYFCSKKGRVLVRGLVEIICLF